MLLCARNFELSFQEIHVDTVSRPPTQLASGAQGDHTTAYIAVMEMLMSAIAGASVNNALARACELAKCFLATSDYQELSAIHDALSLQLAGHVIDRQMRKDITKAIRAVENNLSRIPLESRANLEPLLINREKIKGVIKQQGALLLLEAISKIGEIIITSHQKDPLAVLAKRRTEAVESRPGNEGQRVKDTMLYFKLFNALLELKSMMQGTANTSDKQEIIEDHKERITDIIKASKPAIKHTSKINENFNTFLEKMALAPMANSSSTTTGSTVQGLSGITEAWLVGLNLENHDSVCAVSKLFNDLFDFRAPVDSKLYESDLKKLPQIIAKHTVCVFNAFRQLNNLDESQKRKMVTEFVKVVIQPILQGGQGWVRDLIPGSQASVPSVTGRVFQFIEFKRGSCAFSVGSAVKDPEPRNDDVSTSFKP